MTQIELISTDFLLVIPGAKRGYLPLGEKCIQPLSYDNWLMKEYMNAYSQYIRLIRVIRVRVLKFQPYITSTTL